MDTYDYSIYYERFHNKSESHAESMASWIGDLIRPHLPKDTQAPILDIGCGYGFALRALRSLNYHNTKGLEVSLEQAEQAIKSGFDITITDNTIQWLNNNKSKYHFALLLDVLEHVPNSLQLEFMRAVNAALSPGGKVLLTVPNANSILSSRWRYNDFTHHSAFSEHSLYFVFKNAGFNDIWIDSSKGLGNFPKRIWRRSTWPAIRKWIVRWCWLQVFKAELPWEKIHSISFELNLTATGTKENNQE